MQVRIDVFSFLSFFGRIIEKDPGLEEHTRKYKVGKVQPTFTPRDTAHSMKVLEEKQKL